MDCELLGNNISQLLIPYMIWQKFLGKQQETDKLNDIMYDTIEIFELKKIQLEFKYRSV